MPPCNILVSGSGIAGSAFAYWLLRAYPNANITIVERAPSLRLSGAAVDIRSSAVDIIKWMGTEQDIRKNTTNEKGLQWVDHEGRPIATLEATGNTDMQSFTSEYEIFRGTLAKIFMDTIIDRVHLMFDDYVESYKQNEKSVSVTFARSKDVKEYDLLVAADGLKSKIRGQMLQTKSSEQVVDKGMHICYFTVKRDMLKSCLAKGYSTTGGRCIFLRPDPHPDGHTSCLLMNVTWSSNLQTKEQLNQAIREGTESYKKLMEEMYHDAGWVVPEVLQDMRKSDDFYCSLFGQVSSPRLSNGRVVLLGDAGYATPGFGTSLAIIGAYVLAGELLHNPEDTGMATKRYEELLLPFAKSSQGGSMGGMQLLSPQTQWGIYIRNLVLRFIIWIQLHKLIMLLSSMLGFSERKLSMPDYKWPKPHTL